jgi:hypothetical protein
MTGREIALLQFLGGGSPLSSTEKQEAARIVDLAMHTAPQTWIRLDENGAKVLQQIAAGGPASAGDIRESGRLSSELGKSIDPKLQTTFDMEARIIKAHDPVVFFDRAHNLLVTEQTLRVLQTASTWTAKMFQIPAPDDRFLDTVRETARSGISTVFDQIALDGLVHIERNFPYAGKFFAQVGPQKTDAFFRGNRPRMIDLPDHKAAQLNLAKAAAVISRTGYNNLAGDPNTRNAQGANGLMNGMWNRQMQQNIWGLRHPECGPMGNHPSTCSEAPINSPIHP